MHENLAYSARLRLSRSKPRREQLAVMEEVLAMLQLRHVQHQVVGSTERRGIRCGVWRVGAGRGGLVGGWWVDGWSGGT